MQGVLVTLCGVELPAVLGWPHGHTGQHSWPGPAQLCPACTTTTLPGQRTLTSLHIYPPLTNPAPIYPPWRGVAMSVPSVARVELGWAGLGWAGTRNTRQRGRNNNYTFTGAGHRSYRVLVDCLGCWDDAIRVG